MRSKRDVLFETLGALVVADHAIHSACRTLGPVSETDEYLYLDARDACKAVEKLCRAVRAVIVEGYERNA